MSQGEIIKQIRNYVICLKKNGISIDKAFLYGSYARDKATEESDVDVLLVSGIFDKNFDDIAGRIWVLSKDYNIRLEPYMVGTKKFETDKYSPLFEIVRQEGIEIKI